MVLFDADLVRGDASQLDIKSSKPCNVPLAHTRAKRGLMEP